MAAPPTSEPNDPWDAAKAAFEHFPTLIWRAGPDGQCTYFNQSWLRFTGRTQEEEAGEGWTLGVHPEDFEHCTGTYLSHLAVRTPFEMEYRLRRHDGVYRWIIDTGWPIYTPSGRYSGYIGSCIDITDRRLAEAAAQEREMRLSTLLSSMGEGVIMRDERGKVLMHNATAAEILGMTDAELENWTICGNQIVYLNEDGTPADLESIPPVKALSSGQAQARLLGIDRADGQRRWLWVNSVPLFEEEIGRPLGVVTTLADITAHRSNEEQLRLALTVFRHSVEAIIVTDAQQRILSVNKAFSEVTGYNVADAIGRTPRMLIHSGKHDASFYADMWQDIQAHGFWQGEVTDRRKDGSLYPAALSISAVRDHNGRISHYVAVFSDITERKATEARIAFLAQHDPLTGLPNRTLLHDRLDQALATAARMHGRIALMFLDLDRFKTINDSLGHMVGDRLLQGVAERLSGCVRDSDTVSRQGGDEFLIVLTNIHAPGDAARVAEKILARLEAPFEVDGHLLGTSFSIGIALYPEDGASVETLMKNADTAMYHAKESGRNTYRFFDELMNANALERLQLENVLRRALERQEFQLYYQPQVDLASGRIIGMEALLRWFSSELGSVSPAHFIPLAEECGLIVPIGEWVLEEACRQARTWQDRGFPAVPVAVNLSAMQFRRDDIVATVRKALANSALDGQWLELELTESLLMQSGSNVEATLAALKTLGVRMSIDDFGTGYSSLAYLKRFPVDRLKIDQSFVRDVTDDPDDAAIVRAIIQMGRSLRLEVIAEGTESPEQMDFLRDEGCTAAQGYLFSPPLPADAISELLRIGVLPAAPIQDPH
ncbi:EAL domain-containing protein [Zoogloea sp.]|uniref:sensor domain-containing protein n=1 Tax=Zoogloea sp. TaxID=49181 RepID=UPI0026137299|nr:EAL domain-containing protein [Zoogloea sp.]MDD3354199.1 EAL domain-containing protein [Zoogloea sp.]